MRRKITLKHIAKELDVSISTVSKSLRDSIEISADTRQKVQAFAKLYNYKPNNIALSLKNKKTKTIGVIIPEIVHHFFATVISGVEQVANEKGYNVIVCLSDESFDKEVINLDLLGNGSTDGFIMSLSKETQQKKDFHHIQEVISQGMPVVMFDRVVNEVLTDKVIIDDQLAAYEAVQFLIDKGLKKIALITTVDYVSVGKLRTDGYLKCLRDNNIKIDENLIFKIEDTGIGIEEKNHEKIFKEIGQLNTDHDRCHYGIGLGLYYARLVAEQISGTLSVQSTLNRGSEFALSLPFTTENKPNSTENNVPDTNTENIDDLLL